MHVKSLTYLILFMQRLMATGFLCTAPIGGLGGSQADGLKTPELSAVSGQEVADLLHQLNGQGLLA